MAGMEMRMESRMSQEMQQRMELEQILEMKLEQQLAMRMTLAQYLQYEDIFKGFIHYADDNNTWADFNKEGFSFRYARLPYRLAKPVADMTGPGFAHCWFNPLESTLLGEKYALSQGDWTLFLVRDKVPSELHDFVALHERGEEISCGDHYFASQLEFALAAKRRKVRPYSGFIDQNFPTKFVDLTQKVNFPILPEELLEFLSHQGKRNEVELDNAQRLIEEYPLPTPILKRMAKYEGTNQRVEKKLHKLHNLQLKTYQMFAEGKTAGEVVDAIDTGLREGLSTVTRDEYRVLVPPRINQKWQALYGTLSNDFHGQIGRHLVVPSNFGEAYEKAKAGRRLVEIETRVEDRARAAENSGEFNSGYKCAG